MDYQAQLDTYYALLLKWQKAINLVSPSTLKEAQTRHFDDSLQLLNHLPKSCQFMVDIGSGAGFPGLVLGICRPDIAVTLIESDARKCEFLKTVSRETNASVRIETARIEDVLSDFTPDIITARALSSVRNLLDYCSDNIVANPSLQLLLLKGRGVHDEIKEAQAYHSFSYKLFPSQTADDSFILKISFE